MPETVIMGVDPGSLNTGYGIIRKNGASAAHVDSGVIRMKSAWSQSKRIYNVHIKLEEIVAAHRPEVLVVETLFYGENVQSLIKLGQIRGVILLLGEMHGMEVYEYAPREIKKGMTGYGRAEKGQVIHMVRAVLNLPDLKSPDQADALAVALYHSHLAPTGVSMK